MTRPLLNQRLSGFGTTIFAEMSELAAATGAINLGQGFPDTDGPAEVREAVVRALRDGRGNQYPPAAGVPELRTAVSAHQEHWYGLSYDPDGEVLVTAGATEGIAAALLALLEPGDEVITLEPYYDSYAAGIAMSGATRVTVPLRPDGQRFTLDLAELRAAVTPRTRLLLLNTPHNPSGTVLTRGELAEIAELACEHDLLVISDEVYEHLVFDGDHLPIASFPGMRERTLTVGSAGKTFSFTGWKIGWVTGAEPLVRAVRTAKQYLTYVSGGPFQYALAEALRLPDSYFTGFRDDMRAKRELLCAGLRDAGFGVFVPQGTYFVTADIRPLVAAGVELPSNGPDFCRALPVSHGVVAIPSAVFYDDKEAGAPFIRFAFCKRPEVLAETADRLRAPAQSRRVGDGSSSDPEL
ncbi:pyridoxal phosphate-dependent aminotransferase [Kitasatospora viridis]|uniref:Succinyldiaminopimelate aminotransferase n=1 Tax=Kitasatospora viridis TaxID=281105 RepID=A0A561UCS4_9ACTN|nr:succinyldiaminopimelate aminotransferase [Kitasatospora viridis]